MYTVVTLCVSIQELTTKHLTLFWVGPVKCHIISLYTPLQPFSFSVWLHYKGWNTTYTTTQMVILVNDAWAWRILVQLRSTMQLKYARLGCSCCQRGFESKESCLWQAEAEEKVWAWARPELHWYTSPISLHPPLTLFHPSQVWVIFTSAFFTLLFSLHTPHSFSHFLFLLCFTLDHLPSCSYLCTSHTDLILCNVTLQDLWC